MTISKSNKYIFFVFGGAKETFGGSQALKGLKSLLCGHAFTREKLCRGDRVGHLHVKNMKIIGTRHHSCKPANSNPREGEGPFTCPGRPGAHGFIIRPWPQHSQHSHPQPPLQPHPQHSRIRLTGQNTWEFVRLLGVNLTISKSNKYIFFVFGGAKETFGGSQALKGLKSLLCGHAFTREKLCRGDRVGHLHVKNMKIIGTRHHSCKPANSNPREGEGPFTCPGRPGAHGFIIRPWPQHSQHSHPQPPLQPHPQHSRIRLTGQNTGEFG